MSEYEKIPSVSSSESLDLIFTIVSKGKGEAVTEFLKESYVYVSLICHGHGTAPSSILEMLGLGATEKDVIISFAKHTESSEILHKIGRKFEFSKPGHGISFTVPLQSVAGIMAFKFLTADYSQEV